MAKFIKKTPEMVEAITFNELVAHGILSGAPLTRGMPWSFDYMGTPVTHENDDCYLILCSTGHFRFNRGEMLIVRMNGEAATCPTDVFEATYELAENRG